MTRKVKVELEEEKKKDKLTMNRTGGGKSGGKEWR